MTGIITRAQWGAKAASLPATAMVLPATSVYIHHSVTGVTDNPLADQRAIEAVGLERFGQFSYCVDEETGILTSTGWKSHGDLAIGEEVLTLNHETGLTEWQPLTDVHRFPSETREMLLTQGYHHSSLTTLGHRWPVEREYHRGPGRKVCGWERRFATSETLTTSDRFILAAPPADQPEDPKFSDALVEMVGWFWTEGHIQPNGMSSVITQSYKNAENVDRIRAAMRRLFGPPVDRMVKGKVGRGTPQWREASYDGRRASFHLSADAGALLVRQAPARRLSFEFLRSLTRSQLELLIRVSLLGDGHGNRGLHQQLSQKDKMAADRFQFACLLAGYPATLSRKVPTSTTPYEMWAVGVRVQTRTWVRTTKRSRVQHLGMVWCPEVPNGTWMARRRGTSYFTGNSYVIHPHDGETLEGCGLRRGAHTAGRNSTSFGICWAGNYEERQPKIQQIDATRRLIAELKRQGHLRADAPIRGHRDTGFATACPGSKLYAALDELRRPWEQPAQPARPGGTVYDYEELAVKTMMVHCGPLDGNGNGWVDWDPGFGRDPIIVAVTLRGPSPPDDDGYWMHQANVNLSAQPRGGAVRVTVRNGQAGDTVTAWVAVA